MARKEWSAEEDARLRAIAEDTSHTMSCKEIGELFGRSACSVQRRAARLGYQALGRGHPPIPDPLKESIKRLNDSGETAANIAIILGEDGSRVRSIITSMGLDFNSPFEWTDAEIEWLKANYSTQGRINCAKHLNRTIGTISHKAESLGLRCGKRVIHNSLKRSFDEKAVCAAYLQHQDRKTVADMFSTHPDMISRIVKRHGIEVRLYSRFREYRGDIIRDYQTGEMPTNAIGAKYGLSDDRIREGLKELGLYDPNRKARFANRRNPYDCWVDKYGKEEADKRDQEYRAKQSIRCTGKGNPMYGKPTPQGAGNGWKGWYKDHYFRSLREAMFMIEADTKGLAWVTGERKSTTISYVVDGVDRTYRPDFKIGDTLYEIKPTKLHKTPSVMAKQQAAIAFCAQRGWTYELIDIEIDMLKLKTAYEAGNIRFDRDYEQRFLAYMAV